MSNLNGCRSQKRKKYSQVVSLFFAILGSVCVNAARKTLVKLTPDVWYTRLPNCPGLFDWLYLYL